LVDAQADPAPFEDVPLAGDQVFDRPHPLARVTRTDLDVAEMEPELPRSLFRQRDRDRHRVAAVGGLLDEADHLLVVDLREAQPAGLQQGRVAAPDAIEAADIALDIARLVPVADLELVFLGIEIFLLARDRLVLDELESVVDAVVP